jgi:hypothetical protein
MAVTYYIQLGKSAVWASQDPNIAGARAQRHARMYGGTEMLAKNEEGGGYIVVYGPDGIVTERRPLKEESNT